MDVRSLYLEIMDFLNNQGGTYAHIDTDTYRDIIDAIFDGRCRIDRDECGSIIAFTTWWMIRESDIQLVSAGGRPDDISSGTVVYVADHAGKGAYPELIRFIKSNIGVRGVCWHHRWKRPELFKYYPGKEGDHARS